MTEMDFKQQTQHYLNAINLQLERTMDSLSDAPAGRLIEAMRYSLLGGGKRIRPILLLAAWELVQSHKAEKDAETPAKDEYCLALDLSLTVEMIHTYSLIHDDLPAMDDDKLRRGRPTNHIAFDEATAILSGDALLNLAFERMFSIAEKSGAAGLRAAMLIAERAGSRGMIAGQQLDLDAERSDETSGYSLDDLIKLQELKTGALIESAVLAGAALAGADESLIEALSVFSRNLGSAFQIRDDLLDNESTAEELGKTPGKDKASGKMTYVTLLGKEEAGRYLERTSARAERILQDLTKEGYDTAYLQALTAFLLVRSF